VVFLDLRGFTRFNDSAEPEDVMLVLREYDQAVGQLVNALGGTLERFTGDGIMVYFNDPIPVADPQWRAVALAMASHDRVAALARNGGGVALGSLLASTSVTGLPA
jgi:class 3 adenylate cyclase